MCPPARAQRGSSVSVAARPVSSGAVASRSGSMRTAPTSSQANVRGSVVVGAAHSSWQNAAIRVRPKSPPVRNPVPRNPVVTTGYYLFYGGGAYGVPADSDAAADQPSVAQANEEEEAGGDQSIDKSSHNQSQHTSAVMQQTGDTQPAGEDSYAEQNAAEQEAQAPVPDEGEFTLVLTDGRWIQAVAFTHSNDSIVYITTAGSRYTMPANELDADSTVRVNQERGTPLQSPL